jgi:thiamine kinase
MQPAEIAASVLGVTAGAVVSTERIEHGYTNSSWIVRTADAAVVVRRGNENRDALQLDRVNECRVLRTVGPTGIAPEVLCCDPQRNLLVTRHLDGALWTRAQACESANIGRLARTVRSLHALPLPTDVNITDLHRVVNGYARELEARGWGAIEPLRGELFVMMKLTRELMESVQWRLCHNDIHYLNLVDTGRIVLLDWEYAGIGERMFDLAAIACYHDYSIEQRRELLAHYAEGFDPSLWERLDVCCRVFNYIGKLWFEVRRGAPDTGRVSESER